MNHLTRLLATAGVALVATASLAGCGEMHATVSCEPTTVGVQPAAKYTYRFSGTQMGTVSIALRPPGAKGADQFLDATTDEDATKGSLSHTWSSPATGYKLVLRGGKPNYDVKVQPLTATCPKDSNN